MRVIDCMALALGIGLAAGCAGDAVEVQRGQQAAGQCRLGHAVMTTFDDALQGCAQGQNPNGINCNIYESKDRVYLSGGPTTATLPSGTYFFAVLVPGSQNAGFLDGAEGNLSDPATGDPVANRTFSIDNGVITYTGDGVSTPHALGSYNGKTIIGLYPYDDTTNPGGEYILAVCREGATSPCECKYDAFKVRKGDPNDPPPPPPPVVSGMKYYDANLNGQYDAGEAGIGGWRIDFTDGISGVIETAADGTFIQTLVQDFYWFGEEGATNVITMGSKSIPAWLQTGNTTDQSNVAGGALQSDMTYAFYAADGDVITGIYFGNVCLGAGGGKTLGFWSNKNGQALIDAADLAALRDANLRKADGSNFDPTNNSGFRSWLLGATATNMAYMLSAQYAAMLLNTRNGLVSPWSMIYAPGSPGANAAGLATVQSLLDAANAALGQNGYTVEAGPDRSYQELLKDALDFGNNNLSFLQASAASCPAPLF